MNEVEEEDVGVVGIDSDLLGAQTAENVLKYLGSDK